MPDRGRNQGRRGREKEHDRSHCSTQRNKENNGQNRVNWFIIIVIITTKIGWDTWLILGFWNCGSWRS